MFMPIDGTPRVEIRERRGESPIAGSTSISAALFIGPAPNGPGLYVSNPGNLPQRPVPVASWDEYVRLFGSEFPNRQNNPYIDGYYMAHAVRGFFENGGKKAYILRLRTGAQNEWRIFNNQETQTELFHIYADTDLSPHVRVMPDSAMVSLRNASLTIQDTDEINETKKEIRFAQDVDIPFFVGDSIAVETTPGTIEKAKIVSINSTTNALSLNEWVSVSVGSDIRIADIDPGSTILPEAIRVPYDPSTFTGNGNFTDCFYDGAVVKIRSSDQPDAFVHWALIQRVDTTSRAIFLVPDIQLTDSISNTGEAKITVYSFSMTLDVGNISATLSNLSPVAWSTRYLGTKLENSFGTKSGQVPLRFRLIANPLPSNVENYLVSGVNELEGSPDNPAELNSEDFKEALDKLKDFDEAKLIVVPDAARYTDGRGVAMRNDIKEHCDSMKDRFAILDSNISVNDAAELIDQVSSTRSDSGYIAFYYPWIKVSNPLRPGDFMFVPPSGHIAGMYARVDSERGVHKAPANEKLFGALDVEARLGDESQNSLHDAGINVLRVFKGDSAINVFGGRTTAGAEKTDFRYINVRRLFLFIEDALRRSLREKLYEPNNQQLWKSLKRTIAEFLSRAQQSGAIFGTKPEQGYWIQIDEGNNPVSQQQLGILNIRIGVRPTYPAEYIVVNIGIWDGGLSIEET